MNKKFLLYTSVLLFLIILFTGCDKRFKDNKYNYSFPIPSSWTLYKPNIDKERSDFISKFININKVDTVLYMNSVDFEPSLITSVSYQRYINISKLTENSVIEEDFFNELLSKFGNAQFVQKGTYKNRKLLIAYFEYTFHYSGTDYAYKVHFLSGSIASTQSFYYITPINNKITVEEEMKKIIIGYRKF